MKKAYIFILFILSAFYVAGQEVSSYVIASAGESKEAGEINISWTLGEIAIETLQDDANNLTLTQGFQQGYFEITSIDEPLSGDYDLKVYPNPARDYIWVDLKSEQIKMVVLELYDLEGRLVQNTRFNIMEGPTRVDLNELSASQYILRVVDEGENVLQTFKLIKR